MCQCETFRCGICGEDREAGTYEASEMMLGLRTRFHYSECAGCGSLWLIDPPEDFSAYYPNGYYSFADSATGVKGWLIEYLRAKRDRAYFGRGGMLGRFLARRYEESALLAVSKLAASVEARILDVGCGNGKLLRRMAALGFRNLTGADPYFSDVEDGNDVLIRKCCLRDLEGEKYDVIMFHHSLEHVADPLSTLRTVSQLLSPGGRCIVRLPVVSSAWQQYKTNWVQLDAPRHIWLPTERAMGILADLAGLMVQSVEYDSNEFQFWGSELYARNVPLKSARSRDLTAYIRRKEIVEYRRRAVDLNREKRGDSAAFFLREKRDGFRMNCA